MTNGRVLGYLVVARYRTGKGARPYYDDVQFGPNTLAECISRRTYLEHIPSFNSCEYVIAEIRLMPGEQD